MPFSAADGVQVDEMLDAARRLANYVAATDLDSFVADESLYDAVCMNLLRLGEGAWLLSEEAKAALPDVPWPDIINLRHRIAHGYSHLKSTVLWMIATTSVPPFALALRSLRDRLD